MKKFKIFKKSILTLEIRRIPDSPSNSQDKRLMVSYVEMSHQKEGSCPSFFNRLQRFLCRVETDFDDFDLIRTGFIAFRSRCSLVQIRCRFWSLFAKIALFGTIRGVWSELSSWNLEHWCIGQITWLVLKMSHVGIFWREKITKNWWKLIKMGYYFSTFFEIWFLWFRAYNCSKFHEMF